MHKFKSLNEAFCEGLYLVDSQGLNVSSRGTNQKELLFHQIEIEDPTALTIEPPARRFQPLYAVAEWLWYLSANRSARNIGKWASIWNDITDEDGNVESNYGSYLFGSQDVKTEYHHKGTQWQWVIDELLRDRDTRRATIMINQPYHKFKNPKDYPCTNNMHFFIRENKLFLGVNMRSNCSVHGFCNDVWTFCLFQQLMLNELNTRLPKDQQVELGSYIHSAGSYHVYERHWNMMNLIVNNYRKNNTGNYPETPKYKLNPDVTMGTIIEQWLYLPYKDLTIEQITEHTQEVMNTIFTITEPK
jgi:thymidylate synthase